LIDLVPFSLLPISDPDFALLPAAYSLTQLWERRRLLFSLIVAKGKTLKELGRIFGLR
jgi:hypothetical protein